MSNTKKNNLPKDNLPETIKDLEKRFGKGIIIKMGDKKDITHPSFSSGSLGLDKALGIGGLPKGRVIEIFGPESSGKTTLTLHAIASIQREGGRCAFIDAEHALDIKYASDIGVDVDSLYVSQPGCGDDALEVVDSLINSKGMDLIVVDSVSALTPKAEIEGSMGDAQMGLQARLMSQALRKITGSMAKNNTTVIFINQLRMKIGVFFGNPETTTGGKALKFYTTIRLDIRKIETLKRGEEFVGSKVRVKVIKNKVAPPFKQAVFNIMYGEGIDNVSEIINIAVENDVIDKAGSWYSYKDERLGQGLENIKKFLAENQPVFKKIKDKAIKILNEK